MTFLSQLLSRRMRRGVRGLAVLVAATVLPLAEAAILTGPTVNAANRHTYFLLTQNTWTASEAEAIELGGHLATVDDAMENAWILSTFGSFGGSPKTTWIGLNDAANEGTFVWASGEAVTYTNWSAGEPNNLGGEDFVQIYDSARFGGAFGGKWNDVNNATSEFGVPLHGVVEIFSVPEPTSFAMIAGGLGLLGWASVRRKS